MGPVAMPGRADVVRRAIVPFREGFTADVTDTVAGYHHAVDCDSGGSPMVETHTVTGMGHG